MAASKYVLHDLKDSLNIRVQFVKVEDRDGLIVLYVYRCMLAELIPNANRLFLQVCLESSYQELFKLVVLRNLKGLFVHHVRI